MPNNIRTKYSYRSYDSAGNYKGSLDQYVTTDFSEKQQINTPGYSIDLDLDLSPDNDVKILDNILSEAGDQLLAEDGTPILYDETDMAYGDGTAIALNNKIVVWEYNSYHPAGFIKFQGFISDIKPVYGGSDKLHITVLNFGAQFQKSMIQAGEAINPDTIDPGLTYVPGVDNFGQLFNSKAGGTEQSYWIQAIDAVSNSIEGFNIPMVPDTFTNPHTSVVVHLEMFNTLTDAQNFAGIPFASCSKTVNSNAIQQFRFSSSVALVEGTTYYMRIWAEWDGLVVIQDALVDVYLPNVSNYDNHPDFYDWTGVAWFHETSSNMSFQMVNTTGSTTAAFLNTDPSLIIKQILDDFNDRGGVMTYDGTSIDLTGTSVDYTFVLATVLEGLNKSRELAPGDWYWYGDAGTNLIHFHVKGATADHTLYFKRHIQELDLEDTLENIQNEVFFSGGDTGSGENLYARFANEDSIALYGNKAVKLSDNRVTLIASAELLANDILDNNSLPAKRTTVTVWAGTYDISSFNLGDMVGFGGFQDANDDILLQIVNMDRNADRAVLSLDSIPPRTSKSVKELKDQLAALQTINNPAIPT